MNILQIIINLDKGQVAKDVIGSTRFLTLNGHKVVVVDNLERGHKEAVPADVEFIQADLGDESALKKVFDDHNFEAILHFAAYIEAGESMKDPGIFFRNNVVNTLTLLRTMRHAGVETPASRKRIFDTRLSIASAHESTPEPV